MVYTVYRIFINSYDMNITKCPYHHPSLLSLKLIILGASILIIYMKFDNSKTTLLNFDFDI